MLYFPLVHALMARKRIQERLSGKFCNTGDKGSEGDHHSAEGLLHVIQRESILEEVELSSNSLVSIAVELLLGGQETSASSITSAVLLLGNISTIW